MTHLCHFCRLVFRQFSSECSCLFDSEIQRCLFSFIVFSDCLTLGLVDDCEDSSDVLSDVVDFGDF